MLCTSLDLVSGMPFWAWTEVPALRVDQEFVLRCGQRRDISFFSRSAPRHHLLELLFLSADGAHHIYLVCQDSFIMT